MSEKKLKKELNNHLFQQLDEGVYELKEISRRLFINASMEGDETPIEYIERTERGSCIIEKKDKQALLLFPCSMVVEKFDFILSHERFSNIMENFQEITGCDAPLVYIDGSEQAVGLSTVSRRKMNRIGFNIDIFDFSVETLSTIERICAETHFDKYIKLKMQALEPKTMLEYCQHRIQGQGLQLKKAVYMVYEYMQDVANGTLKQSKNWLLTAPSGSGKTEFYRVVKDLFEQYQIPIPVIQIDLSQITETGFKGANVNTISENILRLNPKAGGVAICFLDEADKKFKPAYDGKGVNVNAAIQSNLLTLIEGKASSEDVDGEKENFDSNKTMFVFMGAFQSLRNDKRKKQNKKESIGFCAASTPADAAKEEDQFYDDLTLQEIIDFGLLEELAGRMVQIVNFHKLSRKDMRKLIQCKVAEISADMRLKIEITEQAVQELLEISFGNLGVRRPMNVIKELTQNAVAEVFFDNGFDRTQDKVVITSIDSAHVQSKIKAKEYPGQEQR